jgi:hypothetical protein
MNRLRKAGVRADWPLELLPVSRSRRLDGFQAAVILLSRLASCSASADYLLRRRRRTPASNPYTQVQARGEQADINRWGLLLCRTTQPPTNSSHIHSIPAMPAFCTT